MPRTCTLCAHPNRLELERELVAGASYRHISERFGTSPAAVTRHRAHVIDSLKAVEAEHDLARTGTLLDDVRRGEARFETLYREAQKILATALNDGDQRTAIQAVRAAVSVQGEARGYLELRGELQGDLGRDRQMPSFSVQIICPQAPSDRLPRVTFTRDDSGVETDAEFETIGLIQR
jgi:hypothetical protein